jgi:hypothetical protein
MTSRSNGDQRHWSCTFAGRTLRANLVEEAAMPQRSPSRIRPATWLVAVMAAVLLTAANPVATAASSDPGTYGVVPGTGTFTALSGATDNLLPGGGTGSQLFFLSTTGTGIHRLPFPLHLFNQFYSNAAISGNGNVQPGISSGGNASPIQQCPPTSAFAGRPSVLVLWGELIYGGGSSNGVFVRTQGTTPHRTFTVSWQGVFAVTAPTTANAQVIFREDSQDVTYVYGTTTFQNLVTIGIQSKQVLSWAARYCGGAGIYPSNGAKLTLRHFG